MLAMYSSVLLFHSWFRWVVLLTGVLAVVRGYSGCRKRRPWTRSDERAGVWFSVSLDVQILVGLLLYFALSPITSAALHDFMGAMKNSALRYWAIEHAFGMIAGVALTHAGRTRIHKTGNDERRHKLAAIFFTLALVAILISIPWPGMPNGRPLIRW